MTRRCKLVRLSFRGGGEFQIGIDGPDDVVVRLGRAPSDPLELGSPPARGGLPAYAHVLLDVLGGTSALSVGAAEAGEAWRVVAPVLAAWEAGESALEEYPAGSAGPP